MSEDKMNKWFTLELNLTDWGALDKRAVEKGYDNSRQMIFGEMEKLSKNKFFAKRCMGRKKKHKNNYKIPEELKDYYNNLACNHSTSISEVIYRYIILPELLLHQLNNNAAEK